jgi:dihydrofolate reductase
MKLIVAVYDDWGIGRSGSQPIILTADRKFFREMTADSTVIVGRKTVADFPESKPLPNRVNVMLSRQNENPPGFIVCHSPEEANRVTDTANCVFVIGGSAVYHAMLPYCNVAYVTKIHVQPQSDVFFPNLDNSPEWTLNAVLRTGEEKGISYTICRYLRISN